MFSIIIHSITRNLTKKIQKKVFKEELINSLNEDDDMIQKKA